MLRFGQFEIDFSTSELRKVGTRVRIQEQPLRILQTLLARRGEIVTREELRDRLWPSDTFVDFDGSLNAAIGKLRQSLSDSADRARRRWRMLRQLNLRRLLPATACWLAGSLLGINF